jgi:hypothetical protein
MPQFTKNDCVSALSDDGLEIGNLRDRNAMKS